MNEKIEFEEVTVKVPKAIMNFLAIFKKDGVTAYLEHAIVDSFRADLETSDSNLVSYKTLVEQYKLKPVFQAILDC